MRTTLFLFIFVVVSVFFQSTVANNNTLLLPLTFNPFLQEGIEIGLAKLFYPQDENFYSKVTISDAVKALGFASTTQVKKNLDGLFILILSAKDHGLTYEVLEYKETSKWSIEIPLEELANASESITSFPITGKITLLAIQEAMFTILEQKYQFNTTELMESMNVTSEKIYSALEPQWIDIVNYITKKKILLLSATYNMSSCYIAISLNITEGQLYNSTLIELDDILVNKTEIIKEMAEKLRNGTTPLGSAAAAKCSTSSSIMPSMTQTMWLTSTSLSKNSSTVFLNNGTAEIKSTKPITSMNKTTTIANKTKGVKTTMLTPTISNTTMFKTVITTPWLTTPITSYFDNTFSTSVTLGKHITNQTNVPNVTVTKHLSNSVNPTSTTNISTSYFVSNLTTTPTANETSSFTYSKPTRNDSRYLNHLTSVTKIVSKSDTIIFPNQSKSNPSPSLTSKKVQITTSLVNYLNKTKVSKITSTELVSKSISMSLKVVNTFISTTKSNPVSPSKSSNIITTPSASSVSFLNKTKVSKITSTEVVSKSISMSQRVVHTFISTTKSNPVSPSKTSNIITTSLVSVPNHTSSLWQSPRVPDSRTTSLRKSTTSSLQSTLSFSTLSMHRIATSTPGKGVMQSSDVRQSNSTAVKKEVSQSTRNVVYQTTSTITTRKLKESSTDLIASVYTTTSEKTNATQSFSKIVTSVYHTTPSSSTTDTGVISERTGDEFDPVMYIVVPVTAFLVLVALVIGVIFCCKHRRDARRQKLKNIEIGSELSQKRLVESLENINKQGTIPGLVNKGSEDRPSRSMSRTSSVSNLETIQEANEPDEPEIYDL